ncbi:MAG: cache domain-containing protein [Alkalibacterium sp.]|nr:cache domain-containing protein [Alkalibacterium sp.]
MHLSIWENTAISWFSARTAKKCAHPSLEGENVWDIEDKAGNGNMPVQDSIATAINGGGFTYFDWYLPNSEAIETKNMYNELDPNWR